jgi:hypothetical protein
MSVTLARCAALAFCLGLSDTALGAKPPEMLCSRADPPVVEVRRDSVCYTGGFKDAIDEIDSAFSKKTLVSIAADECVALLNRVRLLLNAVRRPVASVQPPPPNRPLTVLPLKLARPHHSAFRFARALISRRSWIVCGC